MGQPEFYEYADGKLRIHPHVGQMRALESKARTVLVLSGTQGGKTVTGPFWMLNEIKRKGPGDYMVVTPTYPLLELKALPEFRNLFDDILALGKYVGSPSRQFRFDEMGQRRLFGDSGRDYKTNVFFGYAADPDSLESATAKACWHDEAGQKKYKLGAWQAVQRRLSVHQGRNYLTTTPYTLGWLKDELHDKADGKDIELIRFESIANPRFPVEEWERAKATMPLWKFNLFYRAIFTRPAGLIYDCFNDRMSGLASWVLTLAAYTRPGFTMPNRQTRRTISTANTLKVAERQPSMSKHYCMAKLTFRTRLAAASRKGSGAMSSRLAACTFASLMLQKLRLGLTAYTPSTRSAR
jgi:hypothetical protein